MKPYSLITTFFTFSTTCLLLTACHTSNQEAVDTTPQETLLHHRALVDARTQSDGLHKSSLAPAELLATTQRAAPAGSLHAVAQKRLPEFEQLPITAADGNTETYRALTRNATVQTSVQPVSTFSIDVDTGSYSNVRRFLQAGNLPPTDAVREEELLNYFSYDYSGATDTSKPFSVTTELGTTPWNNKTRLLHVGLQAYAPPDVNDRHANLVFLIDVSGSMDSPDKLGLLKSSISLLAHELGSDDTVSMVVYAGSSGVVLEPTAGSEHRAIDRALSRLTAGGSTNGSEGIQLAYELASDHFKEGGINRVILATDGDFNVGISNVETLKALIARKRESGIALTTLGFGTGNYHDELMEQLADVGNGSYAYIDTLGEARKVLVDERQATLLTVASDVKIQIEFNPAVVSEYRLIGYSNRVLANEDFSNDKVDAGEIGAGHSVTALYEIALHGDGGEKHSPSRYVGQTDTPADAPEDATHPNEVAELRLRYKLPGEADSQLSTRIVSLPDTDADTTAVEPALSEQAGSDNFRFSASVAAFGQLLRGDERLADYDYQDARSLAASALGKDPYGYRAEYLRLLDLASSLDRLSRMTHTSQAMDEG